MICGSQEWNWMGTVDDDSLFLLKLHFNRLSKCLAGKVTVNNDERKQNCRRSTRSSDVAKVEYQESGTRTEDEAWV